MMHFYHENFFQIHKDPDSMNMSNQSIEKSNDDILNNKSFQEMDDSQNIESRSQNQGQILERDENMKLASDTSFKKGNCL
jgi:hypothetical protein